MHVILTFFYLNSGFFDTRLKILTPAPHVVHVTNIRYETPLSIVTTVCPLMVTFLRANSDSSSPLGNGLFSFAHSQSRTEKKKVRASSNSVVLFFLFVIVLVFHSFVIVSSLFVIGRPIHPT